MLWATQLTEVYAQCGFDSTDSTNQTNSARWLNIVRQDIAGRWPWPFLRVRENITTVPDFTGTAGITNGNTNFTDNSFAIGAGTVGRFIQFAGFNDWYKISGFSGPNFPTLETAYVGTTGATIAYTVRKVFYSLSSAVDRILDIRNWNTPVKLVQTGYGTVDYMRPNPQGTNSVVAYITYGIDSSGNVQITPFGFPSDSRLLEVRYLKRLTDVSSGTDVEIPAKWHHIVNFGAIAMGFMYLRKPELASQWANTYEKKIEDMKKEMAQSIDDNDVLKSMDQYTHSNWLRLPEQFPIVY